MSSTLRAAVSDLMDQAKSDLAELLAFRSVADPALQPPEECHRAAEWVVAKFRELGFEDATTSETSDGSLAVHGSAPGPEGSPTVLLYSHYDVQPPLGEDEWNYPVWDLTEGENGRWYGRGTADCKGNVIMHLTALRALRETDGTYPVNLKIVVEGSEEQGTGGLDDFIPENPELLRSDAIVIADAGNAVIGLPTLTTTLRGLSAVDVTLSALESPVHSGVFGGPAPDPVAGLSKLLASLHDEAGNTTIDGLDNSGVWEGQEFPAEMFRQAATVLDGVDLIGDGNVSDMAWARYSATVIGIDLPSVADSANSVQASARARITLRIPPGGNHEESSRALVEHLRSRVPWNLRFEAEVVAAGNPFAGGGDGPAYRAVKAALEESYGQAPISIGQGGSIPICSVLQETYPQAEIILYGIAEPECLIHAPNESVAPSEIEHIAFAEALFLQRFAG
jgi:acetylornithine deacetylase/succinyl-diaminopimelate desuccinylase-like protein